MDSKKRTKILDNDPNSIFKSGRQIYLHELQGATLHSRQPTPDQSDIEQKGFGMLSDLIGQIEQLRQIVDLHYRDIYGEIPPYSTAIDYSSKRDFIKLKGSILGLLKKLSKLNPSIFNDDDIYTLLGLHRDMLFDIQDIRREIREQGYGLTLGTRTFLRDTNDLLTKLLAFIKLINVRGISLPTEPEEAFFDAIEPPDVIPPPEELEVLEPAPAPEMFGMGRYRVLSDRIRKQQPQPFKRYL